jgi:hypothetical protein
MPDADESWLIVISYLLLVGELGAGSCSLSYSR